MNSTKFKNQADDEVVVISRTILNYIVIAVMFFAVGVLIGSISFGVDEAVIEGAVENVLIDAGVIAAPVSMASIVDDDPFLGPEDAPIVMVEFSGYACPFCGRHFVETLEPLLENYGEYIRYVYRDFPSVNQPVAVPASLAANCAIEQNAFWEYHALLFVNQETLFQVQGSNIYLTQLAADLGLDVDSFSTCLTEERYMDEVVNDFNDGIAIGVSGTPGFYINGTAHSGARPYEYFEAVILRELEAAGIDI